MSLERQHHGRRLSVFPLQPTANVASLFKGKGAKEDPNNYRPISLTSVIARLFERLIQDELLKTIPSNYLSADQNGFRKQHSTYDSLMKLNIAITNAIRNKIELPVAFIDITKAYDRVWLDGLL